MDDERVESDGVAGILLRASGSPTVQVARASRLLYRAGELVEISSCWEWAFDRIGKAYGVSIAAD